MEDSGRVLPIPTGSQSFLYSSPDLLSRKVTPLFAPSVIQPIYGTCPCGGLADRQTVLPFGKPHGMAATAGLGVSAGTRSEPRLVREGFPEAVMHRTRREGERAGSGHPSRLVHRAHRGRHTVQRGRGGHGPLKGLQPRRVDPEGAGEAGRVPVFLDPGGSGETRLLAVATWK